jgi:hypothetical protein
MKLEELGHGVLVAAALGGMVAACGDPLVDEGQGPGEVVASQAALHQGDDHGRRCRRPPDDVPAALAVPGDECLAVQAFGTGVQIYNCTGGAWVLKAPEANLLDRHGRYVGNHFLGPTWQWRDGSKIKGTKVAGVPAPSASDVPWLLLSVSGEEGEGALADIKHIQRLHTAGGVAPAGACTEGAEARVPYTADYLFYHPISCSEE